MLLDGKLCSKKIEEKLIIDVNNIIKTKNIIPTLAIIQVGNNPASNVYVRNKIKKAQSVNMRAFLYHYDESISMDELICEIKKLNKDENVHGIIVQLPLPKHLNEEIAINTVDDSKDVDGFGIINKGKLFCNMPSLLPATPKGIMSMLDMYNIDLTGMNAVVVGRSNIVGKPIAQLLLNKNATVTICHSKTKDLKNICKKADILIVAIGKPKFVTEEMVKKGAIVIDVGMNKDENGKLCGDVDFEKVKEIASFITPVPGGVGPLTIISLLENTVLAIKGVAKC